MVKENELYEGKMEEFSPYAQFHFACKGYNFLLNGRKVSRSALFYQGFIDAASLIANKTKVVAVERPKYEPINFK